MNGLSYGYFDREDGLEKYASDSFLPSKEEFKKLVLAISTEPNDWLVRFMHLVHHYFCRNRDYGLLRCIFEDLNYTDAFIGTCVGLCVALRDQEGEDIASLMLEMTIDQRQVVLDYLPFGLDDGLDAKRWARFIKARENGYTEADLQLVMEDRMEKIRMRFKSERDLVNY